jgi:integrase
MKCTKTAETTTAAQKETPWQTVGPNLIRYRSSGKYFARLRVRGKLIVRSLKTNRVTVARLRLADLQKQERQRAEHLTADAAANGKLSFGDAMAIYRRRLEGDAGLKPRTKLYYEERLAALLKSWPGLDKTDASKVTKGACLDWAADYAKRVSPTNFNNTVGVLKRVLEVAVEAGARYDNPARFIKRVSDRIKPRVLPSRSQFEALLKSIKHEKAADLVRFLAYGGFRKSEAANITWGDVDLEKGTILVRGDEKTGTKNGTVRPHFCIPEMKAFLQRLQAENPNRKQSEPVMKAKECRGSLASACKKLGIAKLDHHALRHLFSTRGVESGASLPAVAKLLGHSDGGILLARRYNHVSDAHLVEVAGRITISEPPKPASTNITLSADDHAKLLAELQALRSQVAGTNPAPASTTPAPNTEEAQETHVE